MNILAKLSARSLIKYKTKTIINSIGIFLSILLLSTILILATSYKTSLIATTIHKTGDWHIFVINKSENKVFDYVDEEKIDKYATTYNAGYSKIIECKNKKKPYIQITEVSNDFGILPIRLIEGRYPNNSNEIMIPQSYATLYEKNIDNSLNFDIGKRYSISNDFEMTQFSSYLGEDLEYISKEYTKEYKVVGICETASFLEYGMSPGYTLISVNNSDNYDRAYIKLLNPSLANAITNQETIINIDLMDILGLKQGESTGKMFNLLIAALTILIFCISFILIYNSYMLTLNERIKDYSLMTSLGATNKQLFLATIFENLFLAIIVIPIGIAFSYLILHFSLNNIVSIIKNVSYRNIIFQLNYSFLFVLEIFLIGLLMIFLSSMIPFLINLRKNTIESLRQNKVIKLKPKKEKEKENKRKLELDFIIKGFKRYKNKYKFTIISIIISIVLFISMDVFCKYAILQLDKETDIEYDIYGDISGFGLDYSINTIFTSLSSKNGITKSWWTIASELGNTILTNEEVLTKKAKNYLNENDIPIPVSYIILSDEIFNELLKTANKEKNLYQGADLLIPAYAHIYDYGTGDIIPIFTQEKLEIKLEDDNAKLDTLNVDIINNKLPESMSQFDQMTGIVAFLSLDMADNYLIDMPDTMRVFFNCNDHKKAYNEMTETIEANSWDFYIYDNAESYDKQVNTMGIIDIFSKVFIGIVIVISILNIFNTVITNVIKRRKEFATLTSIGMLDKTIRNIVIWENLFMCLIAAIISLIFTILLSFGLKMLFGVSVFFYPIIKILILIAIYIIFTYLASLLALRSNKNANIIDSLKKDYV